MGTGENGDGYRLPQRETVPVPIFPGPLFPFDSHNQRLQRNVAPSDWVNPTPAPIYNLVVVGAGAAGLVSAAGAAGLGARVALIERDLLGGDCLNVGCVPSKAILSAARVAAGLRRGEQLGIAPKSDGEPRATVDFAAVMERMRRLRADISKVDSAERFRDLGVDVFVGDAVFTGPDQVRVGGHDLRFRRAVIATGARAQAPPIPGLDQVAYLTNETVFSLEALPKRFAVIGAGPVGCELSQAFARFGSEVHLFEAEHGILPKEDPDAAAVVFEALGEDGVSVHCCGKDLRVQARGDEIALTVTSHGEAKELVVDQLLVSVGRTPNVDGLGLETAGVAFDPRAGVTVDDRLRTSNPRIFAAGDICSRFQFTHAADFMARLVLQNALFFGRGKASALTIPWCTYTSPELAQVGLNTAAAAAAGIEVDTYTQQFAEVDRAILEGETEGFVRVHVARGSDRIVGATVVAPNAGDLIGTLSLAMTRKVGLGAIASVIHPYPTQGEAIRKVGDQFNRTKLTPLVKRLFERWFRWLRS